MAYVCIVFLLCISYMSAPCGGERQCIGQDDKPVDWYVVYKLPLLHDSMDPLVQEGLGYYYLDNRAPDVWSRGTVSLNLTNQAIGYTLQQIYTTHKSDTSMYLFYNDETPPKKTSYDHGHTKGVVSFDRQTGFWLVHSLPRFPNYANGSYGYPHSGLVNGQTFLCISLKYKYMNDIGKLFQFNWPQIYDYRYPDVMKADNPDMTSAVNGGHISTPRNLTLTLTSLGGAEFRAFAKSDEFQADLYDAWIAPYYGDDLYTETWQNGRGALNSSCTRGQHRVYNIDQVRIQEEVFSETKDHAKWAVTEGKGGVTVREGGVTVREGGVTVGEGGVTVGEGGVTVWKGGVTVGKGGAKAVEGGVKVVCIGDINRAESQEKRRGGTVCFGNDKVWNLFRQSVSVYEHCPRDQPRDNPRDTRLFWRPGDPLKQHPVRSGNNL